MKRKGYLIEKVADMDNLRLAFFKARKVRRCNAEMVDFENQLDKRLSNLRDQLLLGQVNVGNYSCFKIYDPKERLISAASFEERVLHHALMNVCHEYFERFQIYHSYASRKGKGTFAAVEAARKNQRKYKWFLKLDIHKYFDSVDHGVLKGFINRLFKDPLLLSFFYRIIDSYECTPGKGLPIGSLTSQYLANHYMAVLDHYIQDRFQVSGYVRYMDDFVIWAIDKKQLVEIKDKIICFLQDELKLYCNPFCLRKTCNALDFLGFQLKGNLIRLTRRSRYRYIGKIRRYYKLFDTGVWSEAMLQSHLLPLIAFTEKADCVLFRKQVMKHLYI